MPTKRKRLENRRIGIPYITAAAVEAWRIGDWHGLYDALGLDATAPSPFDVSEADDPENPPRGLFATPSGHVELWQMSLAVRRRLIDMAGPPGRPNRHGDPLGEADANET
jgi:hypothetical protein